MAAPEEIVKDVEAAGASILDGAALLVVSPIVIPALLLGLRPVAKTFVKGSLFLTDTVKQLAITTGKGWSDLLAEARAEAETTPASGWTGTMAAPPHPTNAAPRPDMQGTASAVAGTTAAPPQEDEDDLQGITGIDSKWAALLETAGVETVYELARRNPANLHEKLIQVNEQEHVVDLVPSLEQITDWIVQAQGKTMGPRE
jgi:predicted flap endonuclease-1-like 5' DNA nuclease